ncbi:M48 family metallopeptidase [Hymenobacter fodinae]|uniref:M48 family peptidase n=1 Tax=Hymenobacter fodinae TaxID=2510796 RepID=A0A4Z0P8B9_9BACT|nr:SprT family zinc-dependent metalloprotease [Hymenobacter fodinae]TGE08198.1 M48 family peptidase [Hymenobacter fodinae]
MPELHIDNLRVEIVRKNIRTLRLTVYAHGGRVRVAAPLRTPDAAIREMVLARRAWIEKHQTRFEAREKPIALEYTSGETHFYQGRGYTLRVLLTSGRPWIELLEAEQTLTLWVREGSTQEQRTKVLNAWYREKLKEQLPAMVRQWSGVVGVPEPAWAIKQMKTRWGTCNISAQRIWLNLELMKRPTHCLEYVVVHELVHLHERYHNARFWGLMDRFLPGWQLARQQLNAVSLGSPTGPDAC